MIGEERRIWPVSVYVKKLSRLSKYLTSGRFELIMLIALGLGLNIRQTLLATTRNIQNYKVRMMGLDPET